MLTEEERKRRNAERTAKWREANHERARAGVAKWIEENPEKKKASDKAYRDANKEKIAAQAKARREADPEAYKAWWRDYNAKRAEKRRESYLKRKYNITLADRAAMLEAQGGRCAIKDCTRTDDDERLAVDHDHETGKVRGLLCMEHNTALRTLEKMQKLMFYAAKPTVG